MFDDILKEGKNDKKNNKVPAYELQGQEDQDDHFAPLLPDKNKGDNNIINDSNIIVNEDENNIIPEGEIKPSIIPNDNDNENNNFLDN